MKTVCGANLDHASNERLLWLAQTKGALSGCLWLAVAKRLLVLSFQDA
jgi:hypothetical protein